MQNIIPHLWFDREAKAAAEFYASVFPDSRVNSVRTIHGTPSGDCDIVSFSVWGQSFMAISAGPYFKINPSISFMVNFDPSRDSDAATKIDQIWNALADGGKVLMDIAEYPFSKRYGWIQDKYGVSWQLMLTNPDGEPRPAIIPSMMFANEKFGKAQEATDFYLSVFDGAPTEQGQTKRGMLAPYPDGGVMFTDFMLNNQWFAAMDAPGTHDFTFNEAVSLLVMCDTQDEIDYYWEKLSAVPEAEQCGWCKDAYGVSWQINPRVMGEIMSQGTPEQMQRVTDAFLKMKKFDIATLRAAYDGQN